ncbi:MAG TPA: TIGR03435 family protein [Terracidiphilus sp.]|jgi:uncharacterized protein (TIGR03435 family)
MSANWWKRRFTAVVWLILIAGKPPLTRAQDAYAPTTPLAFEVATVKSDDPNKLIMIELRVYPGGRLIIHGHSLRTLIAEAFDQPGWQIVGGQKWVDELRFDIEGKPPEELRNAMPTGEFSNVGIQDARVRSMLQALLIERFHLKFHLESRPSPVYLLRRGDGPLRLKPAELSLYTRSDDGTVAPSNSYPTGDMGMASGAPVSIHLTSMPQLSSMLANLQRTPVSDQTGLPGFYNFKSKTVLTDEDFRNGGPMHLLVEALPEMGLKLVKTEGVVKKFVIDSAEPPTAN